MTDNTNNPADFDGEMSAYLQTFLDETEEQLDDLVETMLSLENASTNENDLNEAFRLVHSIKGSAGMMGLDQITVLTHHLENRFQRFRSGTEHLDQPTMNLVLRCIDFLRQCNDRLRDSKALGSPAELLDELKRLEDGSTVTDSFQANAGVSSGAEDPGPDPVVQSTSNAAESKVTETSAQPTAYLQSRQTRDPTVFDLVRVVVRFRAGLQLTDLKAQLIVNRLAGLGDIKTTLPVLDSLPEDEYLEEFEIQLETDQDLDRLRATADVDGVESIDFPDIEPKQQIETNVDGPGSQASLDIDPDIADHPPRDHQQPQHSVLAVSAAQTDNSDRDPATAAAQSAAVETPGIAELRLSPVAAETSNASDSSAAGSPASKVAETMRVDIDRLDNLMNLAGELIVNRAQFVQISAQISPPRRRKSALNQIREFCAELRQTILALEAGAAESEDYRALMGQLRSGLELMDEHTEVWEHDRRYLEKFGAAIDQLSRVSQGLQKGVLDTRMVPVGPLFNRFKRVTRDLSKAHGKQVNLMIRGEKTELDKRMIDELGDPLVHLVRNSIDHGLESSDVRLASGKPEVGNIFLEASHSGNDIYIHVGDDGAGIDLGKIKAQLITNRVLTESAADELSDQQTLDYIWHPGFSTAREITDISGRGVGMDVVRNRIRQLNGSIEIESIPRQGTHFTIRLPLTLAIINCLLVRLRGVVFSMPIDEVREIVSVKQQDVVDVQGKQTFDVRDEFIPLVRIDDVFHWHDIDYGHSGPQSEDANFGSQSFEVVILQAGGKRMGLAVDELLGSQDMVIKSLSDNFIGIRGLSGASILGDGSVCLMLDVGTVFQMAIEPRARNATEELRT